MRMKRALGTAAVMATAVAALAVTQAEALPPAPAPASVQATSPSVSPSTGYPPIYNTEGLISCQKGSLCTSVWDPVRKKWRVDRFEKCGTYDLNYWGGRGSYINNQTGGVEGRFIWQDGTARVVAADNKPHSVTWDPYWHIKPC
ncbi:hypothetical protein [Streptomyces sp. NBC_00385]|uniref:hypothetical protein n=1 Tax=Streptomyces sp. NBC_00385 TaxID=2975733 RepID=UPI002DDAA7BE|nr:hypothetical protein [Streptomyces sp. NBC_00385]WRZ08834.1 hypothetical protein OG959_38590 [Streptomyces sp. NBC_00385]